MPSDMPTAAELRDGMRNEVTRLRNDNARLREALEKARKAMRVCGYHLIPEGSPDTADTEEASLQIAREAYEAVNAITNPDD